MSQNFQNDIWIYSPAPTDQTDQQTKTFDFDTVCLISLRILYKVLFEGQGNIAIESNKGFLYNFILSLYTRQFKFELKCFMYSKQFATNQTNVPGNRFRCSNNYWTSVNRVMILSNNSMSQIIMCKQKCKWEKHLTIPHRHDHLQYKLRTFSKNPVHAEFEIVLDFHASRAIFHPNSRFYAPQYSIIMGRQKN
jgi:hypothetical protein